MKLATVETNGQSRLVIVQEDELVDLTAALGGLPCDMTRFLALGSEGGPLAERCVNSHAPRLAVTDVEFRSPILQAGKILGVGMNYHSFVAAVRRLGVPLSSDRIWFYRPNSCLTGPNSDVVLPHDASDLDYEAELAVVIGQRCRCVSLAEAPAMIAGFTVANDLTLRKRVLESVVFGKSFDTHTPLGPWIVTPEDIPDPHDLAVKTWVNGQLRQHSSTSDMIASCYELIAEISSNCTLNPGDVILTGTPDGSGVFQCPPVQLAIGDVVRVEIERIGTIKNRVVGEPALRGRRD